jgi:hypothetical protein
VLPVFFDRMMIATSLNFLGSLLQPSGPLCRQSKIASTSFVPVGSFCTKLSPWHLPVSHEGLSQEAGGAIGGSPSCGLICLPPSFVSTRVPLVQSKNSGLSESGMVARPSSL